MGVGNLFFLTLHALGVKLQFDSQILIGKFCPEGRNFDYNQLLLEGKMIMEMKKQARASFLVFLLLHNYSTFLLLEILEYISTTLMELNDLLFDFENNSLFF